MQQFLFIAAGGSLGAAARYAVSLFAYHSAGETFPWGTLAVNTIGSFLIGMFVGLIDVIDIPTQWRSFVMIGFLGAFTTFSTFTLETVNLFREGEPSRAIGNILANNAAGILFVVLGLFVSSAFFRLWRAS